MLTMNINFLMIYLFEIGIKMLSGAALSHSINKYFLLFINHAGHNFGICIIY